MAQGGLGMGAEVDSEPMDWEAERGISQGDMLTLDFSSKDRQILLGLDLLHAIKSQFGLDVTVDTETSALQIPCFDESLSEKLIKFIDEFHKSVFSTKHGFHFKQDSVLDLKPVQRSLAEAIKNLSVFLEIDAEHKVFKINGESEAGVQDCVEVIKEIIKENEILINDHIREALKNDAHWCKFQKSLKTNYENSGFVFGITEDGILITGLYDCVKKVYEDVKEQIDNFKTAMFPKGTKIGICCTHSEETDNQTSARMKVQFSIDSHDVFRYLKTFYQKFDSVDIEYLEGESEQCLLIKGSSSAVEAAETKLNELKKQITSKVSKFQDGGYFSQTEGQKFLQNTVKHYCQVLFEICKQGQDVNISDDQNNKRLAPFWTEQYGHVFWHWPIVKKCPIGLAESKVDEASAKVVLKMVESKSSTPESPIEVKVVKGMLHATEADILVNTTAQDLCLSNGSVSRSLLKAAGEDMQKEIYTKYTKHIVLKPGETVTSGYGLKCKHVIHGVLCPFVNQQTDDVYKKCIKTLMMESLEEADALKCRKIGFPAIGTGRLSYPTDVVAYEMFQSVHEFGKKHPKTSLKEVLFVIYPDDQQAFQVFKEKQQEMAMDIGEQSEYAKSWIEFRFIGPIENIERARQHVEQRLDLLQSEQVVEIYNVQYGTYNLMRHFYRDEIHKLNQQGVIVDWKNGIVQVNGHQKHLSIAKSEIEQLLHHVLLFPRKTLRVRDTDIAVGDYLKNRNTAELCHIYIPEEKMVVICGKNESLIEKEIQSLSELVLPSVQNVGENAQEIMGEEFSKQILVDDVAEDIYLVMCQKYSDDMDNYVCSYSAGSQTAYVMKEYYPNFKKHLLEVKSYTKDFLVISCDKDYAVIREYIERSAFKDVVCIYYPDQSTVSVFGPDLKSVNGVMHKIKLHAGLIKKTNRASRELTDSFQVSESPEPEDDKDSNESYSKTDAFEFKEHYKADSHTNGARPKHYYNQAPTGKSGFSSGPSFMVKGIKVFVYQSNILHLKVDCIVNAANDTLKHGSGIAEVISKAAGPCLNKECQDYIKDKRKLKTGEVFVSSAGKLNYKRVIHAVGPCWTDYKPHSENKIIQCKQDLHSAVLNSLKEAERLGFQTIAIPAISSAIFAVPKNICTEMYAEAVITYSHQAKSPTRLREIHFVDCNPLIVVKIQEKFREKLSADLGKAGEKPRKQRQHASGSNADPGNQTPYSQRPKSRQRIPAVKSFPYIEERSYDGGFKHELHCHFSSQLHLIVTEGSVFDTFRKVDSVVCSDKKDGRGKGFIAKTLLDKGGRKYKSAVEKAFKRDVKFGDVVSVNGEGTGFRKVLLAVMWDKDPADSEKQREDKFRKMFMSVFRRVVKEKHRTIVMPLLFTGKGKVKPEYCTERFLESCLEFSKQLHDNLTVYLVENEKAKTIKQVAKDFIDLQKTLILSTREQPKPDPERQSPPPFKDEHKDEPGTSKDDNKSEKKSMNPDIEQATLSSQNENCVICMDTLTDPKKLKCGHIFCTDCIDSYFSSCKKVCPTCGAVCGIIRGDQPPGRMDETVARNTHCAGYKSFGTIIITYSFDSGRQGPEHPDPGKPYKGITRTAYLPDNKEGREVCEMLRVAFDRKLVFTIGSSRTTGKEGVITWNDIHHKTNPMPHEQFGYPDPGYLDRVKDELAVKGVTPDDIPMLSHTR